jgi:hypothetical protein
MPSVADYAALQAQRLSLQLAEAMEAVARARSIPEVGRVQLPVVPPHLRALVRTHALRERRVQAVARAVDEAAGRIEALARQARGREARQQLQRLRAEVHTWARGDLSGAWRHAQEVLRRLEPVRLAEVGAEDGERKEGEGDEISPAQQYR